MALLTAVLTHLDAATVERQLDYLRGLAPQADFVVCHGGRRSDFESLGDERALFIGDPSLRGPHFDKSVNQTLQAIYEARVRDDVTVDLVYLIEYDHLILRPDFDRALEQLAARSPAGLFAKQASVRNDTNWSHYLKVSQDKELDRYLGAISRRDDPKLRWGCLGTGLLFRRDALRAFCELDAAPPYYVELWVPTVLYHLGFDIACVDELCDLYRDVRWLPEYSIGDTVALKAAGRTFVHPFKRLDALEAIARSPSRAA